MASLIAEVREAWADPSIRDNAEDAMRIFESYCSEDMPRGPGCDTVLRMAHRLYHGQDVLQASAREYAYRWHLFANRWVNHAESKSTSRFIPSVWQAPHIIGL